MRPTVLLIVLMALVTLSANGQDLKKVVDIVVGIEESLKKRIEDEGSLRKGEIISLKKDIQDIRQSISLVSMSGARTPQGDADPGIDELAHRLENLEKKVQQLSDQPQTAALTESLSSSVAELKKFVEQNKVASPTYTVGGQIRYRTEADAKGFAPEAKPVWFSLLRSCLNLTLKPAQDVSALVQVQDARVFGSGSSQLARGTLDGAAKALDFHQAYFVVTNLFTFPLNVKVGRQELVYGNERFIGSAAWTPIGRTFDAAVLSFVPDGWSVDLITSKLIGSQTTEVSENFRGAYASFRPITGHVWDGFVLLDDNTAEIPKGVDAGASKLDRRTLGAYLRGLLDPFEYEFEFASQSGALALNDSAARATIRASFLSGSLGCVLETSSKLKTSLTFTRISGDDTPQDGEATAFNLLFVTAHKFYGYMDYFPTLLASYGLEQLRLTVSMSLTNALGVSLDVHNFNLNKGMNVTDGQGGTSVQRSLGQEVDATLNLKYNPNLTISAGASAFVPDVVMRPVRGNATAFWSYIMALVSF